MSEIIAPPTVSTSKSGRIPRNCYVCRFIKAKAGKSGKGFKQIEAGFEIISPDIVELPDGSQASVAGRKGTVYMTYDPKANNSADMFAAMVRIGLIAPGASLDVDEAVAKLGSGSIFAKIVLDSEERIERMLPKPGQAYGDPIKDENGNVMSSGWQIKYVSAESLKGAAPAVDGLPPVAGNDVPAGNTPY